ncbi:MAG: hypothetical protein D3910_12400 [Candidatus Electrothrix sp. ATG2]|nr:hypothetical protein [Candidatus Electrothrix sp. ATG2]
MKKSIINWTLQLIGFCIFLFTIREAVLQDYGHVSVNVNFLMIIFLYLFGLSILLNYSDRFFYKEINFTVSFVNCMFGVTLPIVLSKLNILKEKSQWIHAGMLKPPVWKNDFLFFYTLFYISCLVLVSGAVYFLNKKRLGGKSER